MEAFIKIKTDPCIREIKKPVLTWILIMSVERTVSGRSNFILISTFCRNPLSLLDNPSQLTVLRQ